MLELSVWSLLAGPHGQAWPWPLLNVFLLSMRMLCLASKCELKIRVCSLLARPHGQAWVELELKFWFSSMRMLCLASECEFNIRVCSLLARPHGEAWAGLVLKCFWVESWDFYFCTKRSTLLEGVSAPRPFQRPLSSSSTLVEYCVYISMIWTCFCV
jgi:hypothetical protein